jgi:hypothetical protein
MRRNTVAALLILAAPALALLTATAAAQQIVGAVVDEQTGQGIEGAAVTLTDAGGSQLARGLTGREGHFVLNPGAAGSLTLTVTRFGYLSVTSHPIEVEAGERVVVEVRLGVDVIPLDPVVVSGRRQSTPDIAAFYQRLEQGRRTGQGHFISRTEIAQARPARTTDLLRTLSGLRVDRSRTAGRGDVVRMRGGCVPAIFIDGNHINRTDPRHSLDEYVVPASIEGIEVYRGAGRSVGHYYDPRGCGVVLVWTQRGELGATAPFRWRTVGIVLGSILGLVLLIN